MRRNDAKPRRGDVWWYDPDPVRGHEPRRTRPGLIVSADIFNGGPSAMVIICPLTRTDRGFRFRVPIEPPEAGLTSQGFVQCDQVRAVAVDRLERRLGVVRPSTLTSVGLRLRILLDL